MEALTQKQRQEQAERKVEAEATFAEAVAQAAEAGAQAANAEQEAVMSAQHGNGIYRPSTDGLGLLSPFAEHSEGGGLLSRKGEKKKHKEKKKDEPPPEWARPNQLGVKLDVLDSDSEVGADEKRGPSGSSRSSGEAAASAAGGGVEEGGAYRYIASYRDIIGQEKGALPERVFTTGGGEVPMPGVSTLKLKQVCILNDELCINNDELYIQHNELCINNGEFCI